MQQKRLNESEAAGMLSALPGWSLEGGKLTRVFVFSSFEDAFAFMTRCALEIVKLNHHPEWSNDYAKVRVQLTTREAGGISGLDFELASRMNMIHSSNPSFSRD